MARLIGIIGAGNVGTSLGAVLRQKGYPVVGFCCRTAESAQRAAGYLDASDLGQPGEVARQADLVFITTPDQVIADVCSRAARDGGFRSGQVVLHTSGAHSSTLLEPARQAGAAVISLHPLQTFPSVETGIKNIPGSYFTLEGDPGALETGKELVIQLEGLPLAISTEMKPVYHAAACVACNYLVALLDLGLKMLEEAGIARENALPALLPLLEGTFANVKRIGVPAALTGPIDRGDAETVRAHLEALEAKMPAVAHLYRAMGSYTVQVAREKGTLTSVGAKSLLQILVDTAEEDLDVW